MTLKQLCFSFKGRINRKIYWVSLAALAATIFTCWISADSSDDYDNSVIWIIVLFAFPTLAALFIGLTGTVKRLHDTNRSGVCILMVLIPFIGLLYLLVVCGLLKGTDGENDYGPSL